MSESWGPSRGSANRRRPTPPAHYNYLPRRRGPKRAPAAARAAVGAARAARATAATAWTAAARAAVGAARA
eukprot:scaffold48639_cov54-Phaeocystis_antarctica.AAC.1